MNGGRELRIGFDLTGVWRPNTGIFVYAVQLARHLVQYDIKNRYTLFFSGEIHPSFQALEGKFRAVVFPTQDEVVTKQVLMAAACNASRLDLIHFPAFPPPAACFRPFLWTLHDATPWLYPETMDIKGRLYFGRLGTLAVRRSRAVITVSHDSKRKITDTLGVPEKKVFVVHCGIDNAFERVHDQNFLDATRARYQLPEHFILAVGTLEPRKNLPFLIEAYRRFVSSTKMHLGLVIAGRSGWKMESLEPMFKANEHQVVLTGFVPQRDLIALYSLADAFVLPSMYEGFGMPPLEAMACGCPVIVSNRGSLPEVVGDAGLFIDPEDLATLVAAIGTVATNRTLRAELVQKGLDRAKQFSWRDAAAKTLDVYRQIVC